jgi:hypothetical protein
MSVRIATALLNALFVLASLTLSQATQQPLPTPTASVDSGNDSLPKALQRIQMELRQIAEDIGAIDSKMLQRSHNVSDPTVSIASRIHELLRNDDPASRIRDFLGVSQDRLLFDSCLKSGKLYRDLAAEIFRIRPFQPGQRVGQPTLDDEFVQTAQLFFLSRMIPELEIHYGKFQTQAKAVPEAEWAELWHRLQEALRHDDQLLVGKMSALLASSGESPNHFAARVLSQAQKTSPSAAATIVESMAILSTAGDVWKLAEIPGINPVFLSALECQKQVMNSVPVAGFRPALLQAYSCRTSADGSSVQAFTAPLPQSVETTSKAPLSGPTEIPQGPDIFRVPTEKELQDLQNEDSKVDPVPMAPSQPPGFGVSNTPVKRPKIPSWWIRCACPSDHPDAGIVFEGVRWHAPVLQCPNPELRRLEVK